MSLRSKASYIRNIGWRILDGVAPEILRKIDLCIAHEFHKPPYGGGNQFCLALARTLSDRGFVVNKGLFPQPAKSCLFNSFNFDFERMSRLSKFFGRMVHRVDGPIDTYRGDTSLKNDRKISEMNNVLAHATIFQSEYSRKKYLELGLKFNDPCVIHNSVDGSLFHCKGRIDTRLDRKFRLITTAWSSNPNKGGAVYSEIEKILDWNRYSWTFVGNTTERFGQINCLPAMPSHALGNVLRKHDIFVTSSLHESCSNAILEALACGLPVAFIDSGSNGELVKDAGEKFTDASTACIAIEKISKSWNEYSKRIQFTSMESVAEKYVQILGIEK